MSSKDLKNAQKPCNVCSTPSLLRCARCTVKFYCSAEHQKEDSPKHKLVCKTLANEKKDSSSNPTPQAARSSPSNPGERSSNASNSTNKGNKSKSEDLVNEFLAMFPTNLTRDECYLRVIDSYRLWLDDSAKFKGSLRGVYAGEDLSAEFAAYVKLAKPHLPPWWDSKSSAEVLKIASKHAYSNLSRKLTKDDVFAHYSAVAPIIFRQFATDVTGQSMGSITGLGLRV